MAPALLALLVVISLFLILGTIKAARTAPKGPPPKPTDLNTLVDSRFKNTYWDAKGDAAYRRISDEVQFVTRSKYERTSKTTASDRDHYLKLLEAAESPTIQTPTSFQVWESRLNGLPSLIVEGATDEATSGGHRDLIERSFKAAFGLYPKIESNPGSRSLGLAHSAARLYPETVQRLYKLQLSADSLKRILDSMPGEVPFNAEESAIRERVSVYLAAALLNQRPPGVMVPTPPRGAQEASVYQSVEDIDVPETMRLAQEMAGSAMDNLHRPWSQQSREQERFKEIIKGQLEQSQNQPIMAGKRISNEAGLKILASHLGRVNIIPREAFGSLCHYQATRTLVGITLYERRHGRMPETLQDLVRDNIFEKLPLNPFTNEPFRYNKRFKFVTVSVYSNGRLEPVGGDIFFLDQSLAERYLDETRSHGPRPDPVG